MPRAGREMVWGVGGPGPGSRLRGDEGADMTSATTQSARGAGGHRAEARGCGLVFVRRGAADHRLFQPVLSLGIIAADVVALWGLCAHGSRENLQNA